MFSSLNIFDIFIIICGVYMMFGGIQMKVQGKINTGLVLAKNASPDQIKDKEGFIKFMWGKLLAMGIMVTLSGIINMVLGTSEKYMYVDLIINAVFFLILIFYGIVVVKAQKKFLGK